MNILCTFLPFCSPVSPPYSITYIAQFLKKNSKHTVELLDLNAKLHKDHFQEEYKIIVDALKNNHLDVYQEHIVKIKQAFTDFARVHNSTCREGKEDKLIDQALEIITKKKPDIVALSLIYNSQAFFALQLTKKLQEKGLKVVVGGPAMTAQLKRQANFYFPNEVEFLEYLEQKSGNLKEGEHLDMYALDVRQVLDFSEYHAEDYFSPEITIPLRTTSCCYYQQCTFCTHHKGGKYVEYNLDDIKESIRVSHAKSVFIIDDMMHEQRLRELSATLKPLGVKWLCQLKPKGMSKETLQLAYNGGLRAVLWGVESGSQRILDLMKKSTNITEIKQVLANAKDVGISNVLFIMFGFPTETKEEFLETITFLQENPLDLISSAVFGLQEGSPIFDKPEDFAITHVYKQERTMLPDKITFDISEGLTTLEAKDLRRKYRKTLQNLNKYPTEMNIYREHMLFVLK